MFNKQRTKNRKAKYRANKGVNQGMVDVNFNTKMGNKHVVVLKPMKNIRGKIRPCYRSLDRHRTRVKPKIDKEDLKMKKEIEAATTHYNSILLQEEKDIDRTAEYLRKYISR